MTTKPAPDDAMANILASAKALQRVGALDAVEMAQIRKITARKAPDLMTRAEVVGLTGDKIKHIREANNVSQAVFAKLINTKVGTLQKWESGVNRPQGAALKLLHLVKDHGVKLLVH